MYGKNMCAKGWKWFIYKNLKIQWFVIGCLYYECVRRIIKIYKNEYKKSSNFKKLIFCTRVYTLVLVFPALLFLFRSVLPVPLFRLFPVALFWLFLQRLIVWFIDHNHNYHKYILFTWVPVCTPVYVCMCMCYSCVPQNVPGTHVYD